MLQVRPLFPLFLLLLFDELLVSGAPVESIL